MIFTALLVLVVQLMNGVFYIVSAGGHVVSQIPIVDSYLVQGFSSFNSFLYEFPPLQIVWTAFLWYFLYEISLLLVKFFFGHRITL